MQRPSSSEEREGEGGREGGREGEIYLIMKTNLATYNVNNHSDCYSYNADKDNQILMIMIIIIINMLVIVVFIFLVLSLLVQLFCLTV